MKFELKGEKIVEGILKFIYETIIRMALFFLPCLALQFDETIIQIMIIIAWALILNHHREFIILTNKNEDEK